MAFVDIHPRYRETLQGQGLHSAADFLRLEGVIFSGHPDRHVARVTLAGGTAGAAFLKREHRVPWRDRWANAWAGFGFVSKSYREFLLLRALRRCGIGCPEPLAAGEDDQGRTFLLLGDLSGSVDLRTFLHARTLPERRTVARQLGTALARIHAAGFDHPDLYSKHVLVRPAAHGTLFHFLDWQRSRRRRRVAWSCRWRDLATLDATLADDLATPRERLTCLRSYLQAARSEQDKETPSLARTARSIRARTAVLLRRRRIRELRQPPLSPGRQNLMWLDGEALCLTREFRDEIHGRVPRCLLLPDRAEGPANQLRRQSLPLSCDRQAQLVRRSVSRPLRWLWSRLWRKPLASPELDQAGILFRLQRYGVGTPRLLAVGQRHLRRGRTESFLLTEELPDTVGLAQWLAGHSGDRRGTTERKQRKDVLHRAAVMLRRIHEAGCSVGDNPSATRLRVQVNKQGPTVVLGSVEELHRQERPRTHQADLAGLWLAFAPLCSRTEALRFVRSYLDLPRLTPTARRFVRAVQRQLQAGQRSGRYSGRLPA